MRFALRKNFPYGLGDRMKIGSGSFGVVSARSWLRSLGMLLALATILCGRAGAQATSSVTGLVTDPSGAVVVDAQVTLTDPNNAFSATVKTNDSGVYQFPQVPPGEHYALTVSKEGFETATIQGVALAINTKETRDVKLALGNVKTVVEVTTQGETTLNTTDASIGTVINGTRVQDLPSLFVNNAAALLQLAPGVVINASPDSSQAGATTGTRADQANITLDGLDVNDQRNGEAFTTVVSAPLNSIEELNIIVGGNDVTSGHASGAQVGLVTKSGTNHFHGEAFEFNRVTALAANDYFNNLNGVPIPALIRNQFGGDIGGPIIRDKLFFFFTYNGLRQKSSQQIEEVVPLPALGNGQLNYINNGPGCGAGSNIVSTPNCISTTPLTGPNSLQALDPSGIGAAPAILSLLANRPYPMENNFNAGDLINTAGFGFAAPVTYNENSYVGKVDYKLSANNRLFARGSWDRWNNDDNVNHFVQTFPGDPVTALIVNHSRSWVVGDTWTASPTIVNSISFGETTSLLVFPLTSAPTFPNLLSFSNGSGVQIIAPFDNTISGTPSLNSQFPDVSVYQFRDTLSWSRGKHTYQFGGVIKPIVFKSGNVVDTNTYGVGLGGNFNALVPSLRPSDIETADSTGITAWDNLFPIALGRFSAVTGGFNFDKAGNPLPQGTLPIRDYHSTEFEFFAQDTWNIRSDLTLTYGLRWEFHNPLTEVNGFEAVPTISEEQLFPTRLANANAGIEGPTAAPLVSYELGGSANHAPGYYRPSYTDFAPRLGLAYSPAFTDGLLGELFGNRKTSVRAGFGINHDVNLIGQGFSLDETSFLFANSSVTDFGSQGPIAAFSPGGDPRFSGLSSFPAVLPPPPSPRPIFTPNLDANGVPVGFNTGGGFGSGAFFNYDPNYRTPYEMNFSLGFQRELPGNWLVDLSYFGKLGRRLTAVGDPAQTVNFKDPASNQFLYTAFAKVQAQLQAGTPFFNVTNQAWFENQMTKAIQAAGLGSCASVGSTLTQGAFPALSCTQLAAGIAGSAWPNGDVSSTLLDLSLIQLNGNPEQGLIPLNSGLLAQDGAAGFIGNFGSSNYNAMILRVNHRLSRNFTMEFDYTLSHSIDNASDIQNSLVTYTFTGAGEVCDLRNLRVCRGNSNFDARHIVAANFEYALPIGHGEWLLHNSSKLVNEIVGGWKVSGIVLAHSGFPFKVDSGTFPIDFTQSAPALFVGTQGDIKGHIHQVTQGGQTMVQYFSNETNALGAFAFPFGGETGTRNVARGPGFWNLDMSVLKDFKMPWSENQVLQFRTDAFNIFNHPNFEPPNATLQAPGNFGTINSTIPGPDGNSYARQLQLGLKYIF